MGAVARWGRDGVLYGTTSSLSGTHPHFWYPIPLSGTRSFLSGTTSSPSGTTSTHLVPHRLSVTLSKMGGTPTLTSHQTGILHALIFYFVCYD